MKRPNMAAFSPSVTHTCGSSDPTPFRASPVRIWTPKNSSKAVLAGEWPAFFGGSWHPSVSPNDPDAPNVLTFVDGHVNFIKIYWDGVADSDPSTYEPPPRNAYNWDGE